MSASRGGHCGSRPHEPLQIVRVHGYRRKEDPKEGAPRRVP